MRRDICAYNGFGKGVDARYPFARKFAAGLMASRVSAAALIWQSTRVFPPIRLHNIEYVGNLRPEHPDRGISMTPEIQSQKARDLCKLAPVIPVIVIRDAAKGGDLARALVAGGLPVLEVTLRSDAALDAIRAMAKVEGGHVGAGTVLTPDDAKRAKDAGARFAVSPGLTDRLIDTCADLELPLLPGAVTASEVMRAADAGFDMLKFFPAEAVGGAPALKSLAGPLPKISFCPTGGVSLKNAGDYLALPNVVCVGGSWIVTDDDVNAGNWQAIEERARIAAALPRS